MLQENLLKVEYATSRTCQQLKKEQDCKTHCTGAELALSLCNRSISVALYLKLVWTQTKALKRGEENCSVALH